MSERTESPRLGAKFDDALIYAADVHHAQLRKGSDIPYLGHLLSVAGLVIESGGTETEAIAALLHDAAEDAGGADTLVEIEARFGAEVAKIVAECSDTLETPKPPWHERKRCYINHLGGASQAAILVSLADKLDNARAMLRDFRQIGPEVWQRFRVHDPKDHLWYYQSLLTIYAQRSDSWMVQELERVFGELKAEIVASVSGS